MSIHPRAADVRPDHVRHYWYASGLASDTITRAPDCVSIITIASRQYWSRSKNAYVFDGSNDGKRSLD